VSGATLTIRMEGKNIVLKDGRRLNRNHPQGFQSNGVIHVVDTVVLPNWRRTWLGAPEGAPSFAKAINFAWKRSNSRGTLVCSGTMVCTLASHPVVDWTEDERSWFVLVGRIAEGNQHALTEFYDVTNRSLRASTAHPGRLVFR